MAATIKPRAACLIGWPAAHSRSPLIHHYWLRTLGIEGGYNIEAVPPEGLAEFVMHLSAHGFVGANVTIPHKERVLALTVPDARSRAVGAANTLWYDGDVLRSTNTDVEGFIDNLDASAPGWDANRRRAGAGCRRLVARGGVRTRSSAASSACVWRTEPSAGRGRLPINSAKPCIPLRGRRSATRCRVPDF